MKLSNITNWSNPLSIFQKKSTSKKVDEQINKLKNRLNKGTTTTTEEEKFLEIDGLMYYILDGDSEGPRLRLYVPHELAI